MFNCSIYHTSTIIQWSKLITDQSTSKCSLFNILPTWLAYRINSNIVCTILTVITAPRLGCVYYIDEHSRMTVSQKWHMRPSSAWRSAHSTDCWLSWAVWQWQRAQINFQLMQWPTWCPISTSIRCSMLPSLLFPRARWLPPQGHYHSLWITSVQREQPMQLTGHGALYIAFFM